MSSDLHFESVFEPTVSQKPVEYAVKKGGLQYTAQSYQAVAQSASAITFSAPVPSHSTFVDRRVTWQSQVAINFTFTLGAPPAGVAQVCRPGIDFVTCPFPLSSLANSFTLSINDQSISLTTDVLYELLRLADAGDATRVQKIGPAALDVFASCTADAANNASGGMHGYNDAFSGGADVPRGAYANWMWANPLTGQPLPVGAAGNYVVGGVTVNYNAAGVPVTTAAQQAYPLCLVFSLQEFVPMSPFLYALGIPESRTGLFGITSIQLQANMQGPTAARFLRSGTAAGAVSAVSYNTAGNGPFQNARLNLLFATPSLEQQLPAKSIVPLHSVQRYVSSTYAPIAAGSTATLSSPSIVLPNTPDKILLYVRPQSYGISENTWYCPPQSISINWSNAAGLMSSHTQAQLYTESVDNGLNMSYPQFIGKAVTIDGSVQQLTSGPLVIAPGKSFGLMAGEAPGLQGSFTFSVNMTVSNPSAGAVQPVLYIVTISSGVLASTAGVSSIQSAPLTESVILGAPHSEQTQDQISTLVGSGWFSSALGHAKRIAGIAKAGYDMAKQHSPAVKAALRATGHAGAAGIADKMEAVGLGKPTSLARRLM